MCRSVATCFLLIFLPGIDSANYFRLLPGIEEYEAIIENITFCKNSFKKSVGKCFYARYNRTAFVGNCSVLQDINQTIVEKVDVRVFTNGKYRRLAQPTNPSLCLGIKEIYEPFWHVDYSKKDCTVKKGFKNFTINPDVLIHQWIGVKMLIGRIQMRITYTSVKISLMCVVFLINFMKKSKS